MAPVSVRDVVKTMTACIENLRRLADGGEGEWIPFTLDVGAMRGFTEPVMARFRQETGAERPEEFFDYDFRTQSLSASFSGGDPAALHDCVEPGTVFDEWGIGHWAGGAAASYERIFPPLADAESAACVEALPTPVIERGKAAAVVRAYHERGYPVFGYAGSVYEWSWWLRGMQEFMMDLVGDPAMAEAVLAKVADYTRTLALETARAGVDVLCFYDDAGMQTGMQISPDMWRRFVKPRWRDVLGSVRSAFPRCLFFLHCCGQIQEIIPDIIEVGFQVLHPVQPECMEFREIRQRYGRELVLCASMSAQRLFPFGTPDDVREWVRATRQLCSSDNRAILCPSNLIQPETPWENIVAFADAARCR